MDINIAATVIIGAILVQAVIEAIKPIWDESKRHISYSVLASMAVGILIAVTGKLDLAAAIGLQIPAVVSYILTGIIIARGANFVTDILSKISKE